MAVKMSIYMTRYQRDDFNKMKSEISRCLRMKMTITDVIVFLINLIKEAGLEAILKAINYPYNNLIRKVR